MAKTYKIKMTKDQAWNSVNSRKPREYISEGTVAELVENFSYTLECGESWQHEKGNSKINCNPKGVKSLVNMLNKAVNNSAANGYAGKHYELVEN